MQVLYKHSTVSADYIPGGAAWQDYGVRNERYKLIFFNRINEWELFDLKKDPHELKSVYDDPKYAGVQKKMRDELTRLRTERKDKEQFADIQK